MRAKAILLILLSLLFFGCTAVQPVQNTNRVYNDNRPYAGNRSIGTIAYADDVDANGTIRGGMVIFRPFPGGHMREQVNLSEFQNFIADYNATCGGCLSVEIQPIRQTCPNC